MLNDDDVEFSSMTGFSYEDDDQEPEDGYDNRIHGFDDGFYNDEEEIEEDSDPADMKG